MKENEQQRAPDRSPAEPIHDDLGRIFPGAVPGWGLSWWLEEQSLLARWLELTPGERLQQLDRHWQAVAAGWEPPIPRDAWVGPHHPWRPVD